MAFQGSLKELPLPDIVQLVSVSGKTGKFTLSKEGEEGTIFLLNGQIVHAQVGELVGEEAVYALAIWNEGEFVFSPSDENPQQTITRSNTNLLMEAARRLDEWRVLSRKIPSVDMVPELIPRTNRHEQISITPQEWLVVTKVDGNRTIAEIARDIQLSSFEVAKLLYGMLTSELAVLKKKSEAPPPSQPAPRVAPPPAAAAPPAPAPAAAAPRDAEAEALIDLAGRIRGVAEQHVGATGLKSIEKYHRTAIEAIEQGQGLPAVREMIREIEKTTSLLRGSAVAEQLRTEITEMLRVAS